MADEERNKLIKKAPPLSLWCTPTIEDAEFNQNCEILLDECCRGNVRNRRSTYGTIARLFMMNLLSATTPFYRYAAKANDWEAFNNSYGFKTSQLNKVINAAVSLGWIRKLDYVLEVNPAVEGKAQSRIEVLPECPRFLPEVIINFRAADLGRVTTERTGAIGTDSFTYTSENKKSDSHLLKDYNILLLGSDLQHCGTKVHIPGFLRRGVKYGKRRSLISGRFWGGFWQSMGSELRSQITINDQTVSELDYSSMYIRAAYHLQGIEAPEGLYNLLDLQRDVVKKLTNICFNISKPHRKKTLVKALSKQMNAEEINEQYDEIISAFDNKHVLIKELLYSREVGAKLMWIESQVTRDILAYFTSREILTLPIHDSYVIANNHRDQLRELMVSTYENYLHQQPRIREV